MGLRGEPSRSTPAWLGCLVAWGLPAVLLPLLFLSVGASSAPNAEGAEAAAGVYIDLVIVSVFAPVLLAVLGAVALPLGIVGLRRTRDGSQRGRPQAIAAIVGAFVVPALGIAASLVFWLVVGVGSAAYLGVLAFFGLTGR